MDETVGGGMNPGLVPERPVVVVYVGLLDSEYEAFPRPLPRPRLEALDFLQIITIQLKLSKYIVYIIKIWV